MDLGPLQNRFELWTYIVHKYGMGQAQAETQGALSRRRGRPKDPQLEEKTLHAAAQVYGRHGWSGFSFDAVAREAGIGKSSLYARWGDAGDLLAYLIDQRWKALETIDTGSLESDLLVFAQLVLHRYRETGGGVAWHLRRDTATIPDVASKVGTAVRRINEMCRDILRRAQERGELREGVSLSLTAEMLTSALEVRAARSIGQAQDVALEDGLHIQRILQLLMQGIERR